MDQLQVTMLLTQAASLCRQMHLTGAWEGLDDAVDAIDFAQSCVLAAAIITDEQRAMDAKEMADEAWRDAMREDGWIDREGLRA